MRPEEDKQQKGEDADVGVSEDHDEHQRGAEGHHQIDQSLHGFVYTLTEDSAHADEVEAHGVATRCGLVEDEYRVGVAGHVGDQVEGVVKGQGEAEETQVDETEDVEDLKKDSTHWFIFSTHRCNT